MSKRDLKKYLDGLTKSQIQEQFVEMYDKFREVKTYYDFVFNPKEEKLIQEAKVKIYNEYFPSKTKRAKLRRSVSQKFIKQFMTLGVDQFAIADIMLYTIEIAQLYTENKIIKTDTFYKSMLNSYNQLIVFMIEKGIVYDFKNRIYKISENAQKQKWLYFQEYQETLERLDY